MESTDNRLTLDGMIERWIWQKEGIGWGVATIRVADGQTYKIAGQIAHCETGKSYRVTGREEINQYGPTIKVTSIIPIRPRTAAAVRSYLQTLPGIGSQSAAALVEKLGPDGALTAVESAPLDDLRAAGCKRISEEKLAELRAHIAADAESRELDLQIREMLGEFGTEKLVAKVKKQWGDRASSLINQNPWVLTDIPQIGFVRADAIAQRLGVDPESIDRLCAGVLHVVETLRGDGHTKHHFAQITEKATGLLGFRGERGESLVHAGVEQLVEVEALTEVAGDPGWFQVAADARNEGEVAECLAGRAGAPVPFPGDTLLGGAGLMNDQLDALRRIHAAGQHGTAILTGAPGTGKTTMVRAFFPRFPAESIALCAPTGKAAKRLADQAGMPATTIHRLLEPMPQENQKGEVSFVFGRNGENPLDQKLIVVDEASMVDPWLLRSLLRAVRPTTYLLIVGDPNQLPSVSPGAVLRDLIACGRIPHAELTEIKRTNPGLLLTTIHAVKDGRWLPVENHPERDLWVIPARTDADAVERMVSLYLDRLPALLRERGRSDADPIQDIQLLVPWRTKDGLSALVVNEEIQRRRIADGKVTQGGNFPLGVGDKVIQQRNDYELNVVNGDQGVIVDLRKEGHEWRYIVDFIGYPEPVAIPVTKAALDLAYAITVHKSQGSEWPYVVLPAMGTNSPFYDRTLFYTALSRASQGAVIVGDQSGLQRVVDRVSASRRMTQLEEMLRQR